LHCDATHGPSQAKIPQDAPSDNKGKGENLLAYRSGRTALATCISTTMGIKAEDLGVDLRGMTVSVQKEMSKGPPRRSLLYLQKFTSRSPPDHPQREVLEQTAPQLSRAQEPPGGNPSPDQVFLGKDDL